MWLYFLFGPFLSSNHFLILLTHSLKMPLLLCHAEGATPSAYVHTFIKSVQALGCAGG